MRMSFSISRRKATSSASHSEIAMPSAPVRAVEAGALFSVLGFWHGRLLLTRTAKHVWRSLGVAKLARCKGWMAYGQRIETVEKTVSCRFRRSLPGAAGYDFWASNCESAGVEDEWIGRAFCAIFQKTKNKKAPLVSRVSSTCKQAARASLQHPDSAKRDGILLAPP